MWSFNLLEELKKLDGPDREFWENELEIAVEPVLADAAKPGFVQWWLGKRTGRQIDVLYRNLGLDSTTPKRKRKSELSSDDPRLKAYLLVAEFAKFKAHAAVCDFAKTVLPADLLQLCAIGEDDFDSQALCFAIYHRDPQQLRPILHLDKIHKSGFARMKMRDGPRRPAQPLEDFLRADELQAILTKFDKARADGRSSEFKNVLPDTTHQRVFIRRCEKPSVILRGTQVVHGHRPEWIVLEFFDGAKRVNISSLSVADSLAIANSIASAYYGQDCEYENESEITHAKQLQEFLHQLKSVPEGDLVLVEIVVANTPLEGACGMKLTDPESRSIGSAIAHFERVAGNILSSLDNIESIKVLFRQKRVSLIFEQLGEEAYVVRYSDHRLSPTERRQFEEYMRSTYAIPVLSTEKRFKAKP